MRGPAWTPRRRAARRLLSVLLLGIFSLLVVAGGVQILSAVARARLRRDLVASPRAQDLSAATFNAYYFGSSTMLGEPYAPDASIPRIVAHLLGDEVGGRSLRSVNLAVAGADFGLTLERLRMVLRERALFKPSLCVIYAGHNEFLAYHGRAGRLLRSWPAAYSSLAARIDAFFTPLEIDERRLLDTQVLDAASRSRVNDRYGAELREAVDLLQASGVPGIVSTLSSNFADWEPNRSVACSRNPGLAREIEGFMSQGAEREAQGDVGGAATVYREVVALCDGFAEAHYRLGRCYHAQGERDQAWSEYQRAADEDAMPIRAPGALNRFIRDQAGAGLVSTVDSVRALREQSGEALVGFDLMVDGHHPNLQGYIVISRLVATEIRKRLDPGGTPLPALDEGKARVAFGIDGRKDFEVAISRGRWFTRLATWRYDPGRRLARAEELFRTALHLDSSRPEPYLGLAMVHFLRREAEAGDGWLTAAREKDAAEVKRYLGESWVQSVITRAHRSGSTREGRSTSVTARTAG